MDLDTRLLVVVVYDAHPNGGFWVGPYERWAAMRRRIRIGLEQQIRRP